MSDEPTQAHHEPSPDPSPMDVSAYQHAQALDRIAVLEEQLRQMAIERSELTMMAERTGIAESEASQLREAARIDARIALFARMMHEVGETEGDRDPEQTESSIEILMLGAADADTLSRAAARLGLWGMRIADRAIDRARQKLRAERERREAELKAQAPAT